VSSLIKPKVPSGIWIARYVSAVRKEKRPIRFLAARFLAKTRLCYFAKIRLDGFQMFFFPTAMSSALWADCHYHDDDIAFMAAFLRRHDIVVDAGANIGLLTLSAAIIVGEDGQVHAIEAHPRTAQYLRRNVALNNLRNVNVIETALGDREGQVTFRDCDLDDQNCVVTTTDGGVTVSVKSLDMLFEHMLPRIDLLKLDVEGYEHLVIKGARAMLPRTSCIYFESWDEHCARYGTTAEHVVDALVDAGFSVFKWVGASLHPVTKGHRSPKCENLVAVKDATTLASRLIEHGIEVVLPENGVDSDRV
jgi:FkbM family methyltransferase